MSIEIEGEVVQRLDPDETDSYLIEDEVRRHADDRALLVVRASRHHPARFGWSLPLLEPVESYVVAVRDPDLEVGDEAALEITPVVLDGPVDALAGDLGDVLLYFPSSEVEPRLRSIERTLSDAGRST